MSFRTTIILAIIVLILAGVAYYDTQRSEKKKAQEEKQKTLLELKKDDITQIQIARAKDSVQLVASGKDRWEITSPIKTRADEASVGRITSTFEKLQYKDIVDEQGKNLKEYQLDKPEATFNITLKQGKKYKVDVGAKNPVLNINYVRVQNDPRVYSVEGEIGSVSTIPLLDLRDKKLTDFNSEKAESVRVTTPQLNVLFHKEAGSWKMKEPIDSPASDSEVSSLLSSLEFLRATQFMDAPEYTQTASLDKIGFDKPSTVEITLEKGLKQKIDFGNKLGEQMYVRVEGNPSLAMVSDSFSNFFNKKVDDWREKKLVVFNRFDVEKVHIKQKGTEYDFQKGKEDSWTMNAPEKGAVDTEKVQALLEKLELAEIQKFGDEKSLPGETVLEIDLSSKDWQGAQARRHLAFGPVSGEQEPVKNDAYNTIVFVKASTSKEIQDALAGIKPKPTQTKPAAPKK
jgi:Domain of unknown function (DUF4340)